MLFTTYTCFQSLFFPFGSGVGWEMRRMTSLLPLHPLETKRMEAEREAEREVERVERVEREAEREAGREAEREVQREQIAHMARLQEEQR